MYAAHSWPWTAFCALWRSLNYTDNYIHHFSFEDYLTIVNWVPNIRVQSFLVLLLLLFSLKGFVGRGQFSKQILDNLSLIFYTYMLTFKKYDQSLIYESLNNKLQCNYSFQNCFKNLRDKIIRTLCSKGCNTIAKSSKRQR